MEGEWNNSNVSNKKRPRHRRGNSHQVQEEEDDGEGSLTYSAASSSSSAGESTDSSLADIMKALEGDAELAAFCKKDPSMQKKLDKLRKQQQQQQQQQSTEASEASSLNYSTDGESALNGEHLLQTITGQPSASYGPDGGGLGTRQRTQETLDNLLFCEADPSVDTRVDSKFSKKVRTPKTKNTSKSKEERRNRDHREESRNRESQKESRTREDQDDERPRDHVRKVEHSKLNPHPRSSTPPTVPRRSIPAVAADDEVWYAKWWMCGFTDAFRDLVPKR